MLFYYYPILIGLIIYNNLCLISFCKLIYFKYFNDSTLCSDKTVEAKTQVDSAVGNKCEKVELDNKCEKQLTMNKALKTKYFL